MCEETKPDESVIRGIPAVLEAESLEHRCDLLSGGLSRGQNVKQLTPMHPERA